tara:strand:- start:1164 stop:2849 length:1686 start_codon:yes stop_codon:yes gene_type:complete
MSILNECERIILTYKDIQNEISINKDTLDKGVNHLEDLIVVNNGEVKLFDRVCNHSGGKLISNNRGEVFCPMHNWKFNPLSGKYLNNDNSKDALNYEEDSVSIRTNLINKKLEVPNFNKKKEIGIRFLNHACLLIESSDFKFATDPWIVGSAFSNGWWLKNPSPEDSIEELNSCDFIYVSHNHPDHLHPETLSLLNKNIPILVADFRTKSSEDYLKFLGFNNLYPLKHDEGLVDHKLELFITVLKSGDFRDDSGILIKYGEFSALMNVDTNYINFYKLPEEITFLATAFASGASGFPLCFENLTEKQKNTTVVRNKTSQKKINEKLVEASNPKYFLPYAGSFDEKASRDKYINLNNSKNTVGDYSYFEGRYNLELLDFGKHDMFKFVGSNCIKKDSLNKNTMKEPIIDEVINNFKSKYTELSHEYIEQYFRGSNYTKNFILIVSISDDSFNELEQFIVTFGKKIMVKFNTSIDNIEEYYLKHSVNTLHMKVRKESFISVIKNLLPWEDLSIGFQTRITRYPDVYNSDFWYYFTNIYAKYNAVRLAKECDGCELISQSLAKT